MTNRSGTRRRGLLERMMFSFMGPPQLGDVNAPVVQRDVPVALCSQCGRPYDDHEVVRDPGLTFTRCPS